MVKVGDIVVGKASASVIYGITVEGWRGRVIEVCDGGDSIRVESMNGSNRYWVDSKHFTPIVTEEYKKLELTEKIVRDILGCPEGYEIHIKDDCYNPYKITNKGYADGDEDEGDYDDLISMLVGEKYKVVKIDDVVEMTMEEICKALGKNIKIVKGDNE